MGVTFTIRYHEKVVGEDIPRVSREWKERIKKAIEEKLSFEPESFGKPLRRSLKGYRKLRVGDYRIIFRIEKKLVKIFVIEHRSIAYQKTEKRMR